MSGRAALALLLVAGPAAAVKPILTPATQQVWTGATATFTVGAERIAGATGAGLQLAVPAVPGLALGVVRDPMSGQQVDCATSAGATIGLYVVACAGGALKVTVGNAADPVQLQVSWRAAAAGTATLPLTVSCTSDCGGGLSAQATLDVRDYPVTATHQPEAPTVAPGGIAIFDLQIGNGPLAASGVDVSEMVPAGVEVAAIDLGGADVTPTASWSGNGAGEARLNGGLLEVRPVGGTLPAGAQFAARVKLRATALKDGDTLAEAATFTLSAPPAQVAPLVRPAQVTVRAGASPSYRLGQTADARVVRLGDRVTFTLSLSAAGAALPSGSALLDALDPALSLASLRVTAAGVAVGAARCDGTTQALGPLTVTCPPPGAGGPVRLAVSDGNGLAGELRAQIACDVRPTAAASGIDSVARAVDAAGVPLAPDASVHLAVEGAGAEANLLLAVDRSLAQRGDLVPLRATIGASRALAAAIIALDPGPALRPVGAVEIARDDGSGAVTVAATEQAGRLLATLPAIAAGEVWVARFRARVASRAPLGPQPVAALLSDGANPLASARASLRVEADPDFDLATIVGAVWRDLDGDGRRSAGEPGVPGALVVLDDGLSAITDGEGRYHLAAVRPGQRALKVAAHTLPPDARLTTDGTRVVAVTPGVLTVIDFGVAVPPPAPPAARVEIPAAAPLVPTADGLLYPLAGAAAVGARVEVDGRPATVDRGGAWRAEVALRPGRSRFAVVTAWPDGRVVVASRDVYYLVREGGAVVIPRPEVPRLVLRFPPGALAEPRVTVEGSAVGGVPVRSLLVGGGSLAPDREGRFRAEVRLAAGADAAIPVEVTFTDGLSARFRQPLESGGDFALLVGIAEGTLRYVSSSGAGAPSAPGLFADGRVALYAKGRIEGRYLLEGGLDVDSAQLTSWRDLFRGDPTRVFRSLDPNRYYTVYGDASQTTAQAQSRGALYVRIGVDRSQLELGNVQTGMTGVELGRYARSLTGGRLDVVVAGSAPDAPPSTHVIVFGAWLQTARAHDELRGTGGSLYYLARRSVVEGSAQVRVELRDALSDRPIENRALRVGVDCDLDWIAGRVQLRDPLSSLAASPSLTRSGPLDGSRAYLIVDYEYVIVGDSDDGAVGLRATQALGPLTLGASLASELRAGYYLFGGDARLDLGRFGSVVGELAHSEGKLSSFSRSDDGGLTFADAGSSLPRELQSGNAWKAEADLHGFGLALRPYARGIDRGFTDSAHAQDASLLQFGAEATADLLGAHLRLHFDERHVDAGLGASPSVRRDAGGDLGRRFGRLELRIGARTERADDPDPLRAGHRTTLAARVGVVVSDRLTLYTVGQYTVESGGGRGPTSRDASLIAVGADVRLPADLRGSVEGSFGAQGLGGLLGLRRDLGAGRLLYGSYTVSQDRDDVVSSSLSVGGRQRLGESRATLFAEDQFRQERESPLSVDTRRARLRSVGADLPFGDRLFIGASFERGEVTPSGSSGDLTPLARTAGSLQASWAGERLRVQAKGELRSDERPGLSLLQWLASGALTLTPHRDLALRGRALVSRTSDGTRTTEISAGFAWRPSFVDGAALLGRYAFIDDQAPAVQSPGAGGPFAERAHALSFAGEARLFWRISVGEKLAAKLRDDPAGRQWMLLWVNRASLHVTRRLDALVEHRYLAQPGLEAQQGIAVEASWLLFGHLRVGAGYSFTSVSDDELQLGRGSAQGLFVRGQGYY